MSQAEFIYKGVSIIIQCETKDKMKDICQKFKEKAKINNKDLIYSYKGKIGINKDITFESFASTEDKNKNKISVLVLENEIDLSNKEKDIIKSKDVICPECQEKIKIDIIDYKINLYECKNGHKFENILLDEFEETQNIDRTKIICDICRENNKSKAYNNIFYKCLSCNKNICPLCKLKHEQSHKIMNYDDKNYICSKHNEKYISYCENCKMNLCSLCYDHKEHKKIIFIDIAPNKKQLMGALDELKKYINNFNNNINSIINILNEVKNKLNIYYKINEDIIKNYDNKNYENIDYLNRFLNNNIIQELKSIIDYGGIKEKFNIIFNIYKKMNIDEINIIYDVQGIREITLFTELFVKKYSECCTLIIEGNEKKLVNKYKYGLLSKKKEKLKVILKGISNILYKQNIFKYCFPLSATSLPEIPDLITSKVTDLSGMFFGFEFLDSLPDISKWNTSKVINMSSMFENCSSLFSLPDISKWDTSNVINMSSMFERCKFLKSLPDISKWNTSKVINMNKMFDNCSQLISLPDISKWDISNLTNMGNMFYWCRSLKSLPDISKWNTSKVCIMSNVFGDCPQLISIPDISNWNTSNVKTMGGMFYQCSSLKSLPDITKWNISKDTSVESMFYGCSSLKYLPNLSK